MTTYGSHGYNFPFLTTMVTNFIGDNFLGVNFLKVIFLGAVFKREIYRGGKSQKGDFSWVGIFIGDNFHRWQFSGGQFFRGQFCTESLFYKYRIKLLFINIRFTGELLLLLPHSENFNVKMNPCGNHFGNTFFWKI